MPSQPSLFDCSTCPGRVVCRCLQVTEEVVLAVLGRENIQTVKDIGQHTGAGDGCTACHKVLRRYLELRLAQSPSSSPLICSVK
jgi:bacterioferritin-associated ferredoxin